MYEGDGINYSDPGSKKKPGSLPFSDKINLTKIEKKFNETIERPKEKEWFKKFKSVRQNKMQFKPNTEAELIISNSKELTLDSSPIKFISVFFIGLFVLFGILFFVQTFQLISGLGSIDNNVDTNATHIITLQNSMAPFVSSIIYTIPFILLISFFMALLKLISEDAYGVI